MTDPVQFSNLNSSSLHTSSPLVPSPENSPMPANAGSQELRCRLFSVYLRPWVLDADHSTSKVPHMKDLNKIPNEGAGAACHIVMYMDHNRHKSE